MSNQKIKNWIKKNKRALYWPLVGIIYVLGIFLITQFLPRAIMKKIDVLVYYFWSSIPAFLIIPTIIYESICKPLSFCENWTIGYLFIIILLITEAGLFFYGLGYLYNKIKNKWLKILFIIFLIILFLAIIIFGLWTQTVTIA